MLFDWLFCLQRYKIFSNRQIFAAKYLLPCAVGQAISSVNAE
jgi:hypothetical protein